MERGNSEKKWREGKEREGRGGMEGREEGKAEKKEGYIYQTVTYFYQSKLTWFLEVPNGNVRSVLSEQRVVTSVRESFPRVWVRVKCMLTGGCFVPSSLIHVLT